MLKLFFFLILLYLFLAGCTQTKQQFGISMKTDYLFITLQLKAKAVILWIKYILFFYDNFSVILELDIHKQTKKDYS